jgi:hypothetical protein
MDVRTFSASEKDKKGWKDGKALATKRKISLPSTIIKPRGGIVIDMVFHIQLSEQPFSFFLFT